MSPDRIVADAALAARIASLLLAVVLLLLGVFFPLTLGLDFEGGSAARILLDGDVEALRRGLGSDVDVVAYGDTVVVSRSGKGPALPEPHTLALRAVVERGGEQLEGETGPVGVGEVVVDGTDVAHAAVEVDERNQPYVQVVLSEDGGRRFGDWTEAHVGDPLAVVVDDRVVMVPIVRERIGGGRVRIDLGGDAPFEARLGEAQRLAVGLEAGRLPPWEVLSVHEVGAIFPRWGRWVPVLRWVLLGLGPFVALVALLWPARVPRGLAAAVLGPSAAWLVFTAAGGTTTMPVIAVLGALGVGIVALTVLGGRPGPTAPVGATLAAVLGSLVLLASWIALPLTSGPARGGLSVLALGGIAAWLVLLMGLIGGARWPHPPADR